MRPSFHPRLINGHFDDPGVLIPFLLEKRAIIFDLGDINSLSTKDILKISHIFVTHTHMDHFVGFDRILRLFLGREKNLYLYGPEGFIKNIEGKLSGYSWNLVDNFKNGFSLNVTEIYSDHLTSRQYACKNKFIPIQEDIKKHFNCIILKEPALSVSAVILDHRIPCIGFSIEERFHINIIKDRVISLGLEIGPWLKELKQALFNDIDHDSKFKVKYSKINKGKNFILGDLAKQIAIITPGQKITYIADVSYNKHNKKKIIALAKNSDHLFIEAAFLEKDREIADKKYHLTAHKAGKLAGKAKVKRLTIFHFSPRYIGKEYLLIEEAQTAFEKYKK